MIRYALKCANAHEFESWFQSAAAFDVLQAAGQVCCPVCSVTSVEKLLMAPPVRTSRGATTVPNPALTAPANDLETAIAALRAQIEAHSEYVGMNFVSEARKMHAGETPERPIYGEAKPDEARKLIEDGVPVAPLPFLPKAKAN